MLCTDGLANVGLGALDDLKTVEEREVAEAFYEELGREVSYACLCAFLRVKRPIAPLTGTGSDLPPTFCSRYLPLEDCYASLSRLPGLHPEGEL